MKIVLSLLLLVALSSAAHAGFRGYIPGEHVRFRAAAPPPSASLVATDADLARAERDAPVPDPFVENIERRLGLTDDGLRIFGSSHTLERGGVSGSFDGHVVSLHVRW